MTNPDPSEPSAETHSPWFWDQVRQRYACMDHGSIEYLRTEIALADLMSMARSGDSGFGNAGMSPLPGGA
jgi:hypothetical protein